jgi:hypothetical protein
MHTVDLLEQALALAESQGYIVRQDWFGGAGAGACELKGRRWLFVDLALAPREQLEQVLDALSDVVEPQATLPFPELQKVLKLRNVA